MRWPKEKLIESQEQADQFLGYYDDLACRVAGDEAYVARVDAFLWDYVGDAELYSPNFTAFCREVVTGSGVRKCVYNKRMINGVTQSGTLLHVRQASELTGEPDADYFVATADIFEGTVTEWRVNNDAQHPYYTPGVGLELVLAAGRRLDIHDGEAHITVRDPLVRRAQEAEARYLREQAHSQQARVFIRKGSVQFKQFGGMPETVGHLRDFTDQLSDIRGRYADLKAVGGMVGELAVVAKPIGDTFPAVINY